jgi:hypothetical protein
MKRKFGISFIISVIAFTTFESGVAAQAKRNSRVPAKADAPAATTPAPEPTATPDRSKKNERPNADRAAQSTDPAISKSDTDGPRYRYEFSQPDFVVSHIVIEHDEAGKGTIAFKRRLLKDDLTESIEISAATLERLRAAFDALNFIDSTEDYQFERDFSNMGNVIITLHKGGKERTAKYNWTANKDAKILMDEYRRVANQYVWMFDFNLARENQPLETPKLVESLDSLLQRNEIADPQQMLPFLAALSNDERVPLIGRNRAGKLVKQIEKQKK